MGVDPGSYPSHSCTASSRRRVSAWSLVPEPLHSHPASCPGNPGGNSTQASWDKFSKTRGEGVCAVSDNAKG